MSKFKDKLKVMKINNKIWKFEIIFKNVSFEKVSRFYKDPKLMREVIFEGKSLDEMMIEKFDLVKECAD